MRFERRGPLDMVGRDAPCPVHITLNASHRPAHRFQAPDMGFCEGLGRCGIMAQMDVHPVAPVTSRRDLRHVAIDGAGLRACRHDIAMALYLNRPGPTPPPENN